MKKLTLEQTWKLCFKMWRWIAKQKRGGSTKSVGNLKRNWLESNGFSDEYISCDCFFCEYDASRNKSGKTGCHYCPACRVEKSFHCNTDDGMHPLKHSFAKHPIAFYNKLVSLNRKRLKK